MRASVASCALASLVAVATLAVAASAAAALTVFPTVTLLDNFERTAEEKPPSKGGESGTVGELQKPGWLTAGGLFEKADGGYQAGGTGNEYGAYWHPAEYESPAVRVKLAKAPGAGGSFGLWACISSPESAAEFSGYRVEFSVTTTAHYTVTIFRYDGGTGTELAKKETVGLQEGEYIGLTVSGGQVKAWVGEAVVLEASDTKYTKGYVAFFGSGTVQRLKDFEAAVPPTVTSIAPTSGPSAGGTLVTIKGTGFVENATVKIGAEATEVKVRNAEEITAKTAATPAGTDEVIVTDANGTSKEGPKYLYIVPPTTLPEAASLVTQTSATLNAMVNPNSGEINECTFEYGTTEGYGTTIPCSSLPGSGSSPVPVSASLTGLVANTTYHFRISAASVGGASKSSDETFKTLPDPPTIVTESASTVTQTTATLNASVNPNSGNVSECTFEYGTTTAYGSSVLCSVLPGSGGSPVPVSGSVTGLVANTTYHFRIVATNPGGANAGADQTFTTAPNRPAPTITPITPPTPSPAPNSSFALPTRAVVHPKTGATTFQVSLGDPGTFSWLMTFKNGRFGVFSASNAKCTKGKVRLGGRCRPSDIVFGKGSERVAAPGIVTFTVEPSASASKALKRALKQKKELPVTVTLTFQSARGGSPVSHSGSLIVN